MRVDTLKGSYVIINLPEECFPFLFHLHVSHFQLAESIRRRMAEPGFEEEFIQAVRERPTIWDKKSQFYSNSTMSEQEWNQVALKLSCPSE